MLSCDEMVERLSLRLDQQLPVDEVAVVDAHLAACPACAAFASELEATLELTANAPRLELDPALITRTIAAAQARPPIQSPAPFLATLAIAASVLVGGLLQLEWSPVPAARAVRPVASGSPSVVIGPSPRARSKVDTARAERLASASAEYERALAHRAEREQLALVQQSLQMEREALVAFVRAPGLGVLGPTMILLRAQTSARLGDPELAALNYLNLIELPDHRDEAIAGLRVSLSALGSATVDGKPVASFSSAALCRAVLDDATIEVTLKDRALVLLPRIDAREVKELQRIATVRVTGNAAAVEATPIKMRRLMKRAAPMRRMLERRARAR